jgi:RsiW-degrading membrane proteinase PrsW (M82 family)
VAETPANGRKRPGGAWRQGSQQQLSATMSEVLPFFFTDAGTLRKKAFLRPAAAVIVAFALLSYSLQEPVVFICVLAAVFALAVFYLTYQMCGHRKPWWWLASAAAFTGATIVIVLPYLAGNATLAIPQGPAAQAMSLPELFFQCFAKAGLLEELWKIAPLFIVILLSRRLRAAGRPELGIWEPLDGILLAVASAIAFALLENLTSYGVLHPDLVPLFLDYWKKTGHILPLKPEFLLNTLMLTIVRSLDIACGHLAWSGLFGYFIGLAVQRRHSALKLLGAGYLIAAGLHGLWDTAAVTGSLTFEVLVGFFSYFALAVAILKARHISPNRAQNFATEMAPRPEAATPAPAPEPVKMAGPVIIIEGKAHPIQAGRRLLEGTIPGLKSAAADGVVGEFNLNPQDPSRVGLKNLSETAWVWVKATGEKKTVEPGRSVHLVAGSEIHFGTAVGKVS